MTTGEVEFGYASPAIDRAGPFDTAEEAARAPEILRERARAWAEEDAQED
ncbi:SPOR domain-containing protein [Microbacterium thalassium]|nr:SPOR domain-containing protein [Microbacterium thalassium]